MKELSDTNRKRSLRRLRTRIFMRRNGVYLGAMLALLVAAGITAGVLGMKETGTGSPAEKSYDERLKDAAVSTPAPSPAQPANTHKPLPTPEPTAEPTLMPDLTPAPSATAAPLPKDQPAPPVDGILIKGYAMDFLIWSKTLRQWMTHPGVDLAAPKGTEVRTVMPGTVKKVYDDDLLGTTVLIEHEGGVSTLYAGLQKELPVKEGDRVAARGLIGYVGDTAISECADESHLHFELWLNGIPNDPENLIVFKKKAE